MRRREIVVMTARVHAAEIAASFKIEGILKFLTGNSYEARNLRNIYIFKIVPILNPEGVLCGNSRCSLTGTDLNRRWDAPDEVLHPQIYYLKNLMHKLCEEKWQILVFCDLHGHTRKNGSFVYGCNKAANGGVCSWTKVRLLPRILAHHTPLFDYKECRFGIGSSKHRTARVIVWKEFEVTNSFTFESSFHGYTYGNEVIPFTIKDYYTLGEMLLKSLLEYNTLIKGLEKELITTRGWLKPSRLIELTGTPATELVTKEIEEEQRRNHILKFQSIMGNRKRTCLIACQQKKDTEIFKHSRSYFRHSLQAEQNSCANLGLQDKNSAPRRNQNDLLQLKFASLNSKQSETHFEFGWRKYFTLGEIVKALSNIRNGVEEEDSESDSNPSEGNLEKSEIEQFMASLPQQVKPLTTGKNSRVFPKRMSHLSKAEINPLISQTPVKSRMLSRNILRSSGIRQIDSNVKGTIRREQVVPRRVVIPEFISNHKPVTMNMGVVSSSAVAKKLPALTKSKELMRRRKTARTRMETLYNKSKLDSMFISSENTSKAQRLISNGVSDVLGSFPKHDESAAFKKLFRRKENSPRKDSKKYCYKRIQREIINPTLDNLFNKATKSGNESVLKN